MWLIRCDVRIRTAQSGSSGVCGRPGHHSRNRQQEPAGDRLQGETNTARRSTGGAEESCAEHRTRGHGREGVRSPSPDNRITETDHRPADRTSPTSTMWSFNIRTTAADIDAGTGGSQENSEDGRHRRRHTTGTGCNDMGRQTVDRWSPSFEDAVSQCAIIIGSGSSNSPPATRRPRTEVSQLPGHFHIVSSSVERLHCSSPDSQTMQTREVPRRAVEDAVRIQSPEGSGSRPDFATRPAGRRDWARRPASLSTTPGSSVWGPWPSSHHWTDNAGD